MRLIFYSYICNGINCNFYYTILIHFIPCSAIIIVQKFIFLLKEIFEFNMSGTAVPVIRDIYNKLFMSLLWLNQQVYWFWCIAGHRQGDERNATLFASFINEIKQRRPTSPSSQTTVRRDLSCLVDGSLEDRIITCINILAAIFYNTICTTTHVHS